METKFFEFSQNNSGGYFDVDENVCHRVVIEALTEEDAIKRFEPMIENQSGSCSCCGDRWSLYTDEVKLSLWKKTGYPVSVYSHYKDAEERWFKLYGQFPRISEPKWRKSIGGGKEFTGQIYFETIEQYFQMLANNYGHTVPDARIFYANGSKKEIFKKELN